MIAVARRVQNEPIYCWRGIEDLAETLPRDQATATLALGLGASLVQP